MYISGSISDFASRLHSVPSTTGDILTGFKVEGKSYLVAYGSKVHESGRWEAEARNQMYRFTHDSTYIITQVF
jgi:hypothetical protein